MGGQLLHGLNRYYLIVWVGILKFTFAQYLYQLKEHLNEAKFVNMTVFHEVCYALVPLCIAYKTKYKKYQKEVTQVLEVDLPAIMPKFNS